jgi:molecular chaperone GrpE
MSYSEDKGERLEETPAPKETEAPVPAVSEEQAQLQSQLLEKTKEAQEFHDRLLRYAADMENLKKRQEKERAELLQFANENLIKELLPVVDNLERALEHGRQLEAPSALMEGLNLVYQSFIKALNRFGVTAVVCVGEPFDPAFHNAVVQEETTEVPDCTVTKELQKGYLLHNRLLRPAMVVVARNNQKSSCQIDLTV